jgi:hypothetical protein
MRHHALIVTSLLAFVAIGTVALHFIQPNKSSARELSDAGPSDRDEGESLGEQSEMKLPPDRLAAPEMALRQAGARARAPTTPKSPKSQGVDNETSGPELNEQRAEDYQRHAAAERQEMVRKLVASGPAPGGWFQRAEQIRANWSAQAAAELRDKVQLTAFECYAGGCVTNASYADSASYQRFSLDFSQSETFLSWPGQKYRSGPEVDQQTGRVASIWVLMSPETH